MTENIYPIGGYAPGRYKCTCVLCGNTFEGDKRAVQCLLCAISVVWPAIIAYQNFITNSNFKHIHDEVFSDYILIKNIPTVVPVDENTVLQAFINHLLKVQNQ